MIPFSLRLIREHNSLYKAWMRLLWRLHGKQSPIVLMVHGFKPLKEDCKSAFEMTCGSFRKMLEYLVNDGWHAMTWAELLEMVDKRDWKNKCFYVTFDDVYDTVYTDAFPVLKQLDVPFTLFVSPDLVDKPGYITKEHLRALSWEPLCRIGCHGWQHKVFRNLSPDDMTEQCNKGNDWLQDELGVEVDSFAFPYGRIVEVSNKNRKQIQKFNYKMAFSALEGTLKASWFTGRWFLPRINMSEKFVERFTSGDFPRFKDCEGR